MVLENLFLALGSLWAHKMRSFLTTLGIVIGVGAVITVVSLIQGFTRVVTNEIESIGSTTLVVAPHRPPGHEGEKLARVQLTAKDGEDLLRACPSLSRVTPVIQQFHSVKHGDNSVDFMILGTTPDYQDVRNYFVEEGRFFTSLDDRERANVCVLAAAAVKDLKFEGSPVGEDVLIGSKAFRVIGVMEAKGQLLGQNLDQIVLLPFSTAAALWGRDVSDRVALLVHARNARLVKVAQDEIEDALRRLHRLRSDQPNDFEVQSQTEILKAVTKVFDGITYVVAGVTAIALLVGGIGIMNIMLVSVTERTREIGVRKAVGAKRAHILSQFVIEAVVLALLGGLLGIVLGVGAGALVAMAIPNWPGSYVPLWATVLSFGFSSAVGLFFGIYPAAKAARLDPIESLRYE